jgi:hypothetical protein
METITTTAGLELPIQPVSRQLIDKAVARVEKRYRERGEPLDLPTYEVAILGGKSTQREPLDEKSLEAGDEAETARRKTAWAAYQDATGRLAAEKDYLGQKLWLCLGIPVEAPENGWREVQEMLGVEIPVDTPEAPFELKYHWLTTEILKTPDDFLSAITGVTRLSNAGAINEEDYAAAVKSFRDSLQGIAKRELAAAGGRGRAAGDSRNGEASGGPLDGQPDLERGGDSQGVGSDSGPVPGALGG